MSAQPVPTTVDRQLSKHSQRKVLVLNKNCQAINVVTLQRAMKKLTGKHEDGTPKALIVDCANDFQMLTWSDWAQVKPENGEDFIRGGEVTCRVPTIIRMTHFDRLPGTKVHYNRRTIYRRDGNTCQYCRKKKPLSELSLDHVTPRCQGGKTTWENIVVACTDCNKKKAGRTPEEAGMKLLKQPRKPQYELYVGDVIVKDWEAFLGEAFWSVTLENDNRD